MDNPSTTITQRLAALLTALKRQDVASNWADHNWLEEGLIAVSKKQPTTAIREAAAAGVKHFGENYVQEAAQKAAAGAYAGATLHLIGPLQSNKARQAVGLFDVIHTVDSAKLASKLDTAAAERGKTITVFIQVNVANEAQKSGIAPQELPALVTHIQTLSQLHLVGLMTVPPAGEDPVPHFKALAALAKEHHLPRLSMGMSSDWQQALACGATDLRIGTALFGPRPTTTPPTTAPVEHQ